MKDKTLTKQILPYILGFLSFIGLWYIVSLFFSRQLVPNPYNVFKEMFILFYKYNLIRILWITIYRSIIAFFIAVFVGSVIGIISGTSTFMEKYFFIPTVILQGAPPLLWIIPVILLFNVGNISVIAVSVLIVIPLVIINITEGVKNIDRHYFDMFRIYAPSKILVLKELIAPSLFPYYRSIVILGFILSMKSSVVAEWFGSKNGVGRLINSYFYSFNIISFYAVSLVFILMIIITSYLLKTLTSPFLKRRKTFIGNDIKNIDLLLTEKPGSIKLENVSFSYGKKKILNSISLSINKGEVVVLTGKSGSGKTTVARLISGFLKADYGEVTKTVKPAVIYQDDLLLEHLDLLGNVLLPTRVKKGSDGISKAMKALKICGLEGFQNYFIDEISGGMKKRVSLARALLLDPDFIILDEPFNNLDSESRKELWDLFFMIFIDRNIPALIITHYPDELIDKNVKFISLEDGAVVSDKL